MLVRRFAARTSVLALVASCFAIAVPLQKVVLADNTCDEGDGEICVEAAVGLVTSNYYSAGSGTLVCALTSLSDDLAGSDLITTDGDSTLEEGGNAVVEDLGTDVANIKWTPRVATAAGTRVDVTATWRYDNDGSTNGSCDGGGDETSETLVYSTRVVNAYDATSDTRVKIFVAEDGGVGDTPLSFTFSGRGSWSQSTPLYVLGDMVKEQPLTSVTVTGLAGKSVRAQVDFDSSSAMADGNFGTTAGVERPLGAATAGATGTPANAVTCASGCTGAASISVASGDGDIGTWERAWDDNDNDGAVDAGEIRQQGGQDVWYLRVTDTNADGKVTFDLDLHKASKAAFGGFINIEVDADKQAHGFNKGNGDIAFSFNVFAQPLVGFDGIDFVEKATSSSSAFVSDNYTNPAGFTYEYLDPVPLCSANSNVAPCLNSIDSGWALRLRDGWMPAFGEMEMLTLTPYRNTSPYEIDAGDNVEFALRLPTGDVRWQCWGVADNPSGDPCSTSHVASEAMSTANASSYFESFEYDASNPNYGVVTVNMDVRSATRVLTFGSGQANDECQSGLSVGTLSTGSTGVYFDSNLNGSYDAGEESVEPCQNQSDAIFIEKTLIEPGKALIKTKAAHGLSTNDTVTVCCVGAPFDGTHSGPGKIVVADPVGADNPGRYFYIDTTTDMTFGQIDWRPLYGLNVDDGEQRQGMAAEGNAVRIAETQLGTEITLSRPPISALAGGFVTTNAQGFAFGPNMMTGTAFDFGVAGPSFTADNEESGTSRRSDGFFQVCIPSGFVSSVFGLTVASAASSLQTTRSDAGGASAAVSPTAAAATCGTGAGLQLELANFGFSAPYFNTRKASTTSTPAVVPETSAPIVAAPAVTAPTTPMVNQLPARQVPGRGVLVPISIAPPAALGSAVGMKAATDSVSIALRLPALGTNRRASEYVISLVVPGKGVVKQITVKAGTKASTLSATFPKLGSGRYAIRVVGKSKTGSALGRWRSPTVRLRN